MTLRPLNPFAAIEQTINAGTQALLANAVASHQGGEAFGVIFDRTEADPFTGAVDASTRTCAFSLEMAPTIAEGHTITIGGMDFTVAGGVEPDESGWVQLRVYPKA